MASLAEPSQYVTVVQLVNTYAAFHVQADSKKFISEKPTKDLRVAITAAEAFAKASNIPFMEGVYSLNPPPITVIKDKEQWVPAELHPDRITLIEGTLDNAPIWRGPQEYAMACAKAIANLRSASFVPSIGLSLSEPKESKEDSKS